jgi:phytoene synthase
MKKIKTQFQWENNLLSLALKGSKYNRKESISCSDNTRIDEAYEYCNEITRTNSKTFHLASGLLPIEKRRAVRSLYAFCRVTDDIVDRVGNNNVIAELTKWHNQIITPEHHDKNDKDDQKALVALAWCESRERYSVPMIYAEQLICGVAQDLTKNRYRNFSDLVAYCYGVACTVGLMSMHITGYTEDDAIPYAIRLGVALQMTNILRDVAEDWQMGRLYLPKDELEAFGLTEEDIDRGVVTEAWRKFMRFQIQRTRMLYASALPGLRQLHRDGRFAIGAAAELYQAILDEIEKNDYDVFSRRTFVRKSRKLLSLPGIWWKSYKVRYPEVTDPLHSPH